MNNLKSNWYIAEIGMPYASLAAAKQAVRIMAELGELLYVGDIKVIRHYVDGKLISQVFFDTDVTGRVHFDKPIKI